MNLKDNNSGIVLIEAAFGFFILILILSAIVDFGFAMKEHATMVEASRSGSLAAVKVGNRTPAQRAERIAKRVLDGSGFDPDSYTYQIQTVNLENVDTNLPNVGQALELVIIKPEGGRISFFRNTFNSRVQATIVTDLALSQNLAAPPVP